MPDIAGRPQLKLRGDTQLNLAGTRFTTHPAPLWRWSMHGTLAWRSCPNQEWVPRRLRGKPCGYKIRWNGGRDLSDARFSS